MADTSKNYQDMTPAEKVRHDTDLTAFYQRQMKMSGFRATIALNERNEAVHGKEALEARMQVFGLHRQLGDLAIREGVDMAAAKTQYEARLAQSEQAPDATASDIPKPDSADLPAPVAKTPIVVE